MSDIATCLQAFEHSTQDPEDDSDDLVDHGMNALLLKSDDDERYEQSHYLMLLQMLQRAVEM
jgi:hypothetical protein